MNMMARRMEIPFDPRRQFGTVLVFKPGTTKLEAEAAVASLRDVLDDQYWLQPLPIVHEFTPAHGGPVWYIP